jgi:hypothetical protein
MTKNISCELCKDQGVFFRTHILEPGCWTFRCHCLRGEKYEDQGIPQYKKEYEKYFRLCEEPLT